MAKKPPPRRLSQVSLVRRRSVWNMRLHRVADLTPLRGTPLTSLLIHATKATDLTPLEGMDLTYLRFSPARITRGIEVIRKMKSLTTIGWSSGLGDERPAAEFWKRYAAGKFRKPYLSSLFRLFGEERRDDEPVG